MAAERGGPGEPAGVQNVCGEPANPRASYTFQLEAFRHVGHGTLAALIGPGGIVMDEDVRRVSEGSAALMAEFQALPPPSG